MSSEPYVSDAPITDSKNDRFRRWPFAKRVADTIATRKDPSSLVIAVYGIWGDGKTTLLNFIDGELQNRPDVMVVRFNPWRFADESALLRHFFAELARLVGTSLTTKKEEVGKALAKYGELLELAWSGAGKVASSAGTLLSTTDLEEEKRRVGEALRQGGKRIVVLMDDIDRLEKSEIQALFRLVKLSADFDFTAYVLAFDADMVASAIGERFTSEEGKRSQAGRSFLEKIVQVPLTLPAIPTEELRSFCFEAIDEAFKVAELELDENESRRFVLQFQKGVEVRLKTPRMAKRYGNALAFSLAINRGEVNTVDMMLVEAIRVFYPDAFTLVRQSKDILLGDERANEKLSPKKATQLLEEAGKGLNSEEQFALKKLLDHLFPRMGATRYGGSEQEFAAQQRVASEQYFDRYFTYSVSAADISDLSVRNFVESMESSSVEEGVRLLKNLVTPKTAGAVVSKLRGKVKTLSSTAVKNIAVATAHSGGLFPNPPSLFWDQPFSQAAILIYNLIELVPKHERLKFTLQLIDETNPIAFAMEVAKWLCSGEESKPDEKVLTKEEEQKLLTKLAGRIGEFCLTEKPTPLATGAQEVCSMLTTWALHGESGKARSFVTKMIKEDSRLAIPLIQSFSPLSFSVAGTKVGGFERRNYDLLAVVIDGATLFDALYSIFPSQIDDSSYCRDRSLSDDLRMTNQFAFIHKAVLAEAEKSSKKPGEDE